MFRGGFELVYCFLFYFKLVVMVCIGYVIVMGVFLLFCGDYWVVVYVYNI